MNGIVDLNTFKWHPPMAVEIPAHEKDALNYNRDAKMQLNKNDRKLKVHCNTNRICEVEDAVVEWINVKETKPMLNVSLENFMRLGSSLCFKVLSLSYNELDMHFSKITLMAIRPGEIVLR